MKIVSISASNSLSAGYGARLNKIKSDKERWKELLKMEIQASAEPGCIDMGTHMIAVAQKT